MKPSDVAMPRIGMFTGTMEHAEVEAVAVMVVRWHQLNSPDEWVDVTPNQIAGLLAPEGDGDHMVKDWRENPIWLQSFFMGIQRSLDEGWLEGWVNGEGDIPGRATPKFLEALKGSIWNKANR